MVRPSSLSVSLSRGSNASMGNDFPFGLPPFDVAHVDFASRVSYGDPSPELTPNADTYALSLATLAWHKLEER